MFEPESSHINVKLTVPYVIKDNVLLDLYNHIESGDNRALDGATGCDERNTMLGRCLPLLKQVNMRRQQQ